MFYQSYDDYMRDLFYYNGLNRNNFNQASPYTYENSYLNSNNYFQYNPYLRRNQYNPNIQMQNVSNLNNLYPSIYRIVYPVVQRVTNENNYPIINDEIVTDVSNRVYNIVEGDLDSAQNSLSGNQQERNANSAVNSENLNNSYNNANNQNNYNSRNSNSNGANIAQENRLNNVQRNNENNLLLKDLIRILVIRELLCHASRRGMQDQNIPQNYYLNNTMVPYFM